MQTVDWGHISQTGEIPKGFKLIRDSRPFQVIKKDILSEDAHGNPKVMRLKGVFQRADEKNANGRIYPYEVLKGAVNDIQEAVAERRVMGEFDHPPDAKIHMDRVSHLLTKLWMEDKVVYGELEVINDERCPCGAQLACFIERGIQIGISSRGVGDMEVTRLDEGEEAYEVQEGFSFVTFDTVAEPSVSGTQLMVMESKQRKINEAARVQTKHDAERNLIKEAHNLFSSWR